VIALDQVSKTYTLKGKTLVPAVQDVSLTVERGEFVFITGRSGSGKTTLLNLVAGLTRPTSGRVMLDGVDMWVLPDKEQSLLRNQKVGFAFQFPSLLPSLTALDNVALPTIFGPGQSRRDAYNRAAELLEMVGLSDKLRAHPRQLSAGQLGRVVVARALMNRPQLLLADEPTGNLDEKTELEIMDLFRDLHRSLGITILMVTHTRELVSYGTHAAEMVSGRIVNGKTPVRAPTPPSVNSPL
jgi:ABC-type lipoprotein export system ATPase subunit